MLHPLVDIAGISLVGKKFLQLNGTSLNLWILVCFAATYPLAWLSLQLFETPLRDRINSIRRTARSRRPQPATGSGT